MKSIAHKDQPFPELVPEFVEGVKGNSHNDTEAYPYEYGFRYVEQFYRDLSTVKNCSKAAQLL